MILVTAAAGRTGRSLISALVRRGHPVRAFDIAPGVAGLGELGAAETVTGDMLDPAAVAAAVAGVEALIHIGPPMHPREAEMGHAVVSAARRAGVRHFVQFSVTHPQLEPLLNHQAKLAVERMVLLSRIPFTILQPMHYMQNIDVRRVVERGVLTQPFDLDTPLQHVDLDDVTEAAALVVGDPRHHYATYELCGSDYLMPVNSPPSSSRSPAGRWCLSRCRPAEPSVPALILRQRGPVPPARPIEPPPARHRPRRTTGGATPWSASSTITDATGSPATPTSWAGCWAGRPPASRSTSAAPWLAPEGSRRAPRRVLRGAGGHRGGS